MVDPRRELHLLVRDASRRRVLVTPGDPPALPVMTVEPAPGQWTVSAAVPALRERYDIRAPILEVQFAYEHGEASGPVPVLTVTEARRRPDPPDGLAWHDIDAGDPATHPMLEPRLAELLAEWRSGAEPPALRPRWARDGWHARATEWLTSHLAEVGRPPTGEIEQVRHWGISALMTVPTAGGLVWFKAVFPPFHHEPAVTRFLAETFPTLVPVVLAIEPEEGWLVTADLGAVTARDADAAVRRRAIDSLIELQQAMTARTAELLELGCPVRPIRALADQVAAVLAERPVLPGADMPDDAAVALIERVRLAAGRVDELGMSETIVHGDFHPGNVAVRDDRVVIFDWSDTAVSHPLVDVVTSYDDAAEQETAWSAFVEGWSSVCPPAVLEPCLADVVTVGAAYQVVSYADIIRNLEPLRRPELADGLTDFLRVAAGSARRQSEG